MLIVALAALFFTVFKRNTPARITLAVIEAGAIGNLIDRLALGYVRDMVDVSPLGFGVCNFADFFITFGGVALLIIIAFIGKDALFPLTKKWREEAKAEEDRKEALKGAADHTEGVSSAQDAETPSTEAEVSPEEGNIEISVDAPKNSEFALCLRIPSWSKVSQVAVNGKAIGNIQPGSYVTIKQLWQSGDKVTVNLDMRGRLTELNGYQAIERGPIVLARDSRFNDGFVDETSIVQADAEGYVTLMPVAEEERPEKMWMAFTAPMVMGTDLEGDLAKPLQIKLCDFSSAGNTWNRAIRYRVWLKKTLDVRGLKPNE